LKTPEGTCARAGALRSASTFSMTVCRRCTWSAVTVSRCRGGVVVKRARNRHVWNYLACPSCS
jgi:hypothetical protein